MANETELSNSAKRTDDISVGISAALVKHVVYTNLIYKEDLPVGTATKLARKDGSLTADSTVSESGAYSFGAGSELSQGTVTATAAKTVCVSKLTVEAQQFGNIDAGKLIEEQGKAIARKLDDDGLGLSASLSTSVTATSILTVNDCLEAAWTVRAARGGMGKLAALLDYKGVKEISKEIMSSGATPFSQPAFTSLLGDGIAANGYVGDLPGLGIYVGDGLPATGGDDQGMVFNPATCFFGMYSPSINTRSVWVGSGGFWDEVASYLFSKTVIWNNAAGCMLRSDT